MPHAYSGILAEAVNTIHLISIEQQNEEENTLGTQSSNNQGNFSKQFSFYFIESSWWYKLMVALQTFICF